MEELYAEGVAIHGGPESCVGVREGGGEALTGVRAGQAIEPRNFVIGVPTLSQRWKATLPGRFRESSVGSAGSENQGMYGTSMCENREGPCPPVQMISGRAVQGTLRRYA